MRRTKEVRDVRARKAKAKLFSMKTTEKLSQRWGYELVRAGETTFRT